MASDSTLRVGVWVFRCRCMQRQRNRRCTQSYVAVGHREQSICILNGRVPVLVLADRCVCVTPPLCCNALGRDDPAGTLRNSVHPCKIMATEAHVVSAHAAVPMWHGLWAGFKYLGLTYQNRAISAHSNHLGMFPIKVA